jgi:methionyl-tRNA formyltransferase
MRFAVATLDSCLPVMKELLALGWTPVKMFTYPEYQNCRFASTRRTVLEAQSRKIPIQLSRMEESDLKDLGERGCEVLVSIGYKWRIGDWRPYLPHAINFHPSPLPEARGTGVAIRAILEKRTQWGVTCHKIAPEFDSGDILAQESFPVSPGDCSDILDVKSRMAMVRLAGRVARGFRELWDKAVQQGPGSYWPQPTEEDRVLNLARPVEDNLRLAAAYGMAGVIAKVGSWRVWATRVSGWVERHEHAPGKIVFQHAHDIVLAAADGYIYLAEWKRL